MATFTLFGVTPANTSIYWCFYHIADTYLLPSGLGGRVMLKVTWGPAPPGAEESHGNLVVVMIASDVEACMEITIVVRQLTKEMKWKFGEEKAITVADLEGEDVVSDCGRPARQQLLSPVLVPRPSLSLHPSQGVSLGDNVTLRCHLPQPAAWVRLYQYQNATYIKQKDKVQDMAEFSLTGIKQVDAVRYQCQYQGLAPAGTSQKSDPVELEVTDHRYPPPGISLSPKEHVEMGSNITIQCWNKEYGASFLLHKAGHSAPIQHQEPDDGGTATFTLFGVTPADSGTYRCSYRIRSCCLLFSPLGDNVTLEVIPRPAPPGDNGGASRDLVAAVVGRWVAAIVFIIILTVSVLLVDQRRQMQSDESPGATPRSPEVVQFQVTDVSTAL
eukprot:XP_025001806.1 immunoglobulin superfamily member 1-like [Gallus gallus]